MLFIHYLTFSGLPELTSVLNSDDVEELLSLEEPVDSNALKQVFQSLMTSNKAAITNSLQSLLARLEKEGNTILCIFAHVELQHRATQAC